MSRHCSESAHFKMVLMNTIPLVRIHGPGDIRIDQVERPRTGPNDVLVQVQRCGICGSDLSYTKLGGIPGAAKPFALGHEFSGVVVETGQNVQHVAIGDRVIVNPDVRPLISHHFPLSRFDEAFALAQQSDQALKVMVDCQS